MSSPSIIRAGTGQLRSLSACSSRHAARYTPSSTRRSRCYPSVAPRSSRTQPVLRAGPAECSCTALRTRQPRGMCRRCVQRVNSC